MRPAEQRRPPLRAGGALFAAPPPAPPPLGGGPPARGRAGRGVAANRPPLRPPLPFPCSPPFSRAGAGARPPPPRGAGACPRPWSQLTKGEDVVDPTTWAGSVPQVQGIAPRVRVGRSRWFNLLWLLPIGFVVLIVAVAAAKGLRNMPSVERFIVRYPGTIESAGARTNAGLPVWWECCTSSTCSSCCSSSDPSADPQ